MDTVTNGAGGSYELGLETLRKMWGDAPAQMLAEVETDFSRDIYRLVISSCFGACWSDATLSPKIRSLVTVAIVAALGRERETEMHVVWALRNGCTPEELREVIKHVTAYAGAPAGVEAATVADRVLAREGAES
jgi:alkylhydroperoxidase/carboxymuconolactone decarboxylase family protein YurZ